MAKQQAGDLKCSVMRAIGALRQALFAMIDEDPSTPNEVMELETAIAEFEKLVYANRLSHAWKVKLLYKREVFFDGSDLS